MGESAAEQLDRSRVIEAQTILGPLWVEREGEILTPSLVEGGMWDLPITTLMQKLLRPGMTFVDAGANIGYFSVLGSRLVGPTGRVYAVEPDPSNLAILRANLERLDCTNVTVLPVAAWFEPAELDFHRPADGAVARVGQDDGSGLRIQADRLDALVEGPVDYLKVDCELTDYVVVQGAEGLLREQPSMLVSVEFHPWDASHLGHSPAEVLEGYRSMGLHPYEIVRKGISATSWARIAAPELPEGHISFDFVLSRGDPAELRARGVLTRKGLLDRPPVKRTAERVLKTAGDLLEYVPERIRPPIRRRDRWRKAT
jgi:FkbM family methyltransferase